MKARSSNSGWLPAPCPGILTHVNGYPGMFLQGNTRQSYAIYFQITVQNIQQGVRRLCLVGYAILTTVFSFPVPLR